MQMNIIVRYRWAFWASYMLPHIQMLYQILFRLVVPLLSWLGAFFEAPSNFFGDDDIRQEQRRPELSTWCTAGVWLLTCVLWGFDFYNLTCPFARTYVMKACACYLYLFIIRISGSWFFSKVMSVCFTIPFWKMWTVAFQLMPSFIENVH